MTTKKRPENLETVLLSLELLRRIPRNRKVTAAELHREIAQSGLERDVRTIQRQLEMLSEHFDIERDDRSKPYGYSWKPRSQGLALPMLSEQESLLLMLAEQQLKALLPAKLMKSMESFFVQARANLGPHENAKQAREWFTKIRVIPTTQPLLPPAIKPSVFEEVSNALYGNNWLDIEYQSVKGKNTKAKVMPLGIAQQGVGLYLVCRFEGFDNERILAIHRIVAAKASPFIFERPSGFSMEKYDLEGHFGFGDGKKIKLKFKIEKLSGEHLLEMRLSEDQTVKDLGDCYEITATVIDTKKLDWWLLGFGERVRDIRKTVPAQSIPSIKK